MPEIPVYPLVTTIHEGTGSDEWFTNGHVMFHAGAAAVIPTRSAPLNREPVSPGKLAARMERSLPEMAPVLDLQFGCPVEPGMLALARCSGFRAAVAAEYLFTAMAAAPGAKLFARFQAWPTKNDTGIVWSQGEVVLVRGGKIVAAVAPRWPLDEGGCDAQLRHALTGPRVPVLELTLRQPTVAELRGFWAAELDMLREDRQDLADDLTLTQRKIRTLEEDADKLREELPVLQSDLMDLDLLINSRQALVEATA